MKALYIPSGPKNLRTLYTQINFMDVEFYSVELLDELGQVIATSNVYHPEACSEDHVRIHFVNSCGAVDSIGMKLTAKESSTKSESWQRPLADPLDRTVHGTNRFDITGLETSTAKTTDYGEEDMDWIEELFRTPAAWIEWTSDQGEGLGYLPIVIMDTKLEKLKEEDRYTYEVSIQFQLSHSSVNHRN